MIWVIEIRYPGGKWTPTVAVELDAHSGTHRRKMMEHQAQLMYKDELEKLPQYRVQRYERSVK